MGPRNDQSAVDNYPRLPGKYWIIQGISKSLGRRIQDDTTFSSKADAIEEAERLAQLTPGAVFYVLEAMESVTVIDPIVRTQL